MADTIKLLPPEKPTHNMAVLAVNRGESDPLLCPIMTNTVLIGVKQSQISGELQQIISPAVAVACVGPVCAIYDRRRKCCSFQTGVAAS